MSKASESTARARGPGAVIGWALKGTLYAAWVALIVVAPLAAAWVASSLAAHAGGSTRVAAASGLFFFPVLPVAWETFASWRRARRAAPGRRFLTLLDRLVLRTLVPSVVFVGLVCGVRPRRAFEALNARGDWMLDGRHDARSESARRALFWTAARARFLDRTTDDNPFHEQGVPKPHPVGEATQVRVEGTPKREPLPDARPDPNPPPEPPPAPEPARDTHAWPWPSTLHAAVASIPADVETSPASVGRHLAAQEPDAWQRAKAVHDYVADRIAYDVEAYRSGRYPRQDAETTFHTRRSVCAGYAALFEAIGRAAGLTVETVIGRARGMEADGMGEGHAWSAVKLDDAWLLVDATWDAGYVDAGGFHKKYATSYFLAPPEIFLAKHFPDKATWQLLSPPRTEGEYLRMPAMRPEFFAHGLQLRRPDRAESDATGIAEITIDNPQRASILASASAGGADEPCDVTGDASVTIRCALPAPGTYAVVLFASNERYGTHWGAGTLRFVNR
jgi:hypothetical protein